MHQNTTPDLNSFQTQTNIKTIWYSQINTTHQGPQLPQIQFTIHFYMQKLTNVSYLHCKNHILNPTLIKISHTCPTAKMFELNTLSKGRLDQFCKKLQNLPRQITQIQSTNEATQFRQQRHFIVENE